MKPAFLQGHMLDREVYIQPPKEAKVKKRQLWKLRVALYNSNDASLQFFSKSKKTLLELGCKQLKRFSTRGLTKGNLLG